MRDLWNSCIRSHRSSVLSSDCTIQLRAQITCMKIVIQQGMLHNLWDNWSRVSFPSSGKCGRNQPRMASRSQESKIASWGIIHIIRPDAAGLNRRYPPSAHGRQSCKLGVAGGWGTECSCWWLWRAFLSLTAERGTYTSCCIHFYPLSLWQIYHALIFLAEICQFFMVVKLSWKDLWKPLPILKVSEL